MFTVAIAVLPLLQAAQRPQPTAWKLGGSDSAGYVMEASGAATDTSGATLTLRSRGAKRSDSGSAIGEAPAGALAGRRVRISADIDTHNVSGSASVWIRVDSASQMLGLDNGLDQALTGTTASRHMDVSVYVPKSATRLAFGLLLSGTGEATARRLRIVAGPIVAPDAPLAPDAARELDSALRLVRRQSLWRDTVTWGPLEAQTRRVAAGAATAADVYPAIRYLLSRLGDHHSFLMRPQGAAAFRTGGADNPRPIVRVQTAGIGYVSVPAYGGGDRAAIADYARTLQDSLAAAVKNGAGACRWIVDLRSDGGGNMWPMLAGLRPFLGDAGLGSFVTAAGSGPLWHADYVADIVPTPALAPLDSAYVAVLTGPRTASSGEAVTIAFRGRPRTRSFGLPTRGLSTANSGYPLPDGSMIFLTTALEADRTGTRYGAQIQPDEEVPAGLPGDENDLQLDRAISWLDSQRCGEPSSSTTSRRGG